MQADTLTLQKLLSSERRYIVPTYQRHYEWTKAGQWELLFDDLEARANELHSARTRAKAQGESVTKAEAKVQSHFLGAIVLEGLSHPSGSLDLCHVIDGQQRLTTLQLLCRGILDVLVERNSARASKVLRLIQNPEDTIGSPEEIHKLWPRRRDRDTWRIAMAPEVPTVSEHRYLEARSYFAQRAREAMTGPNGEDLSDTVVDALLTLFKMVVIDLDESDDAQVIFEVLNARQTALSATDLVKNLLFLRAELDHDEVEALYQRYWGHFDDAWWETTLGRGHAARGRRDVLLSSWLSAKTGAEVNVEHLYGEVRRFLDEAEETIPAVLDSIYTSATAFRRILDPPATSAPELKRAYTRISKLNLTTALPLLVWLEANAPKLGPDQHRRAVHAVDSWVMRRVIVRANTRDYAKRIVEILRAAQQSDDSEVADAIELAFGRAGSESNPWPTDEDVEEAFLQNRFYDRYPPDRIRMILGAIDERLHQENVKGERPTFDYDELTIEHILPDQWQQHWPLGTADPAQQLILTQRRDQLKHRLGNLTLVSEPLNPAMSNGPWPEKRKALDSYSHLRLNALLRSKEQWNEDEIEARARDLARWACRIWSRPSTIPETPSSAIMEQSGNSRAWDWPRLQARIHEQAGPEAVQGAVRIKDWCEANASGVHFMSNQTGSFIPLFSTTHPLYPLKVSGDGKLVFQMNNLAKKGPFSSPHFRAALLQRLNEVFARDWGEEFIEKRPRVSLEQLADNSTWQRFVPVLEWLQAQAKGGKVH